MIGFVSACLLLLATVVGFAPRRQTIQGLSCVMKSVGDGRDGMDDSLMSFFEEVESSMNRESFVSVSLGKPRQSKTVRSAVEPGSPPVIRSVEGRVVSLKAGLRLQLNFRYSTNEQVKNIELGKASTASLNDLIILHGFRMARLTTTTKVFDLTVNHATGSSRLFETEKLTKLPSQEALMHDRQKLRPVDPSSPFLRALKVTTESGRPLTGMADKLRQIERFTEILAQLVDSSPVLSNRRRLTTENPFLSSVPPAPLKIVDMGSGLSYLTFSLHSYFRSRYSQAVQTLGVEARSELVEQCSTVAKSLGPEWDGLSFQRGHIDEYFFAPTTIPSTVVTGVRSRKRALAMAPMSTPPRPGPIKSLDGVDVLVSLHACDVATDHAIFSGIVNNASVIVTSPCCHKEVRQQMVSRADGGSGDETWQGLGVLLEYGLFRERTAEMVTDAIRVLCLEWADYDTKVIEFVDGHHTAKNVMIAATKRSVRIGDQDAKCKAGVKSRLLALLSASGVKQQSLVTLLGIK